MSRRVGLFGGTFDPPHLAHLVAAEMACEQLHLDEVRFIPCAIPALKSKAAAPPEVRLEMTRAAIHGRPGFTVSDLELRRPGTSYTVETLQALAESEPASSFWWLLGADALRDFPRWRQPERIVELARLAVVDRFGAGLSEILSGLPGPLRERVDEVDMPAMAIASSGLRQRVSEGLSIRFQIPQGVLSLVQKHRLYRDA